MADATRPLAPPGVPRRAVSRVRTRLGLSVAMAVFAAGAIVLAWLAVQEFIGSLGVEGTARTFWVTLAGAAWVASLGLVFPAAQAIRRSLQARGLAARGRSSDARIAADKAKDWCWYVAGLGLTVLIVSFLVWFFSIDDAVIRRTFLNGELIWDSRQQIWKGFQLNIKLFVVAEVLVLVFGLLLAIARLFPGRPGAPVRFLAVAYADVFRGFPAIVVFFLFVLGMQIAGIDDRLPLFKELSRSDKLFWLAVFALVIVYSAYVAEVYRAGLESIHWSQTAAARGLGLSYPQTLRYVIVPQAVRRIMPPLLNDFIALQKDTALLSVVGLLEAVQRSRIIANSQFNLSPILGAGMAFLLITIPLARLTDWLVKRDQARMQAGG